MSMFSHSPAPETSGPEAEMERTVAARALDAQAELLPYALAFFGVAMPAFVWAGAHAADAAWMSAIFIQFSLNWAAFYALTRLLRRKPQLRDSTRVRTALHIGAGLLWSFTVAEIAVFGAGAGPARDVILSMDVAAAVTCCFFAAPSLESLLIVGSSAAAGPLTALGLLSGEQAVFTAASGALAMAMALCLILNRILRRQFALAAERDHLIVQRAASLAQAERLAKSKSHILATLSHEIRNGLSAVTHVLSAAAGMSGRAAPSREQLSAALNATHELLDVLNATLDTETAGAGRLTLVTRPFDGARLARASVMLWRPRAAAKGLELDIHVEDAAAATGAAMGDPVRVRQILSNLIGNAVKYTARGRVEVRVQRCGADRIRFEVADTGPGLTPEELARAFEPFSRIERVGLGLPGAGLGLSLSSELARLMGGEVLAESATGVGSRFWFELPFDAAAVTAAEPEADEEVRPNAPAAPGRSLRVLVAEDDALNAAMLRAMLEQLGHQVVHAHEGRRALELAEICNFDLIMLDGRMPHLTGPEAAGEIRALSGAAGDAPIIAVIGGDTDEVEDCVLAGADEVLRKPVTVTAVARAVAAALGSSRRRPGEQRPPVISEAG
jgi:signal transduction histidine kinase/ActR/RegA family two-component response regulator